MHDVQSLLSLQNLAGEQMAPLWQPPGFVPPPPEYVQVDVEVLQAAPGSLGQIERQSSSSLQKDCGQKVSCSQGRVVVGVLAQPTSGAGGAVSPAKAGAKAKSSARTKSMKGFFLFIRVSSDWQSIQY